MARTQYTYTCPGCTTTFHSIQKIRRYCSHSCAQRNREFAPRADRFWSKVKKSTDPLGCWLWIAALNALGYGQFRMRTGDHAGMDLAHRVAYELTYGPIPTGMLVCHRCDNPGCVRPDHLFLGSNADNIADRSAKGRDARVRGERNGNAKLTENNVREIRRRREAGEYTTTLGAEFGVSNVLISLIARRKAWKHVS